MWSSWYVWIFLLLGRYDGSKTANVAAEATASTTHTVGFARAEASYDCEIALRAACSERGCGAVVEPGYADPVCEVDDGLATCVVTCWSACAPRDSDY